MKKNAKLNRERDSSPVQHQVVVRRSAQMFIKDIRDPFIIEMIMKDYKELSLYNYVVPLTQEFIDTYLQESENDIKARGTPDEAKGTVPLWQPMINGKPVGEKVSAKLLYAKMGGTLFDEIRLPSPQ